MVVRVRRAGKTHVRWAGTRLHKTSVNGKLVKEHTSLLVAATLVLSGPCVSPQLCSDSILLFSLFRYLFGIHEEFLSSHQGWFAVLTEVVHAEPSSLSRGFAAQFSCFKRSARRGAQQREA